MTIEAETFTYTLDRNNNFNLIRFIAASLVLISHSFALVHGSGDFEPLRSRIGMTWGSIAVDIFFLTSGFLITYSYLSRQNLAMFAWARILRIYPALVVATAFSIVIGACFTNLSVGEYLAHPQTHKFILKNITLFFGVEVQLPEVFSNAPFSGVTNGSLWILPYEVKMYAILACVLVVSLRWRRFISVGVVIPAIAAVLLCLHIYNYFELSRHGTFIRLSCMFFLGSAIFACKQKFVPSNKQAFILLCTVLLSVLHPHVFFISYCVVLPLLLLYSAFAISGVVRKFNSFGDYSYGLYIYAFPVQQSLAVLIHSISVFSMILLSFAITLLLSILSWHFIECKFLSMKETGLRNLLLQDKSFKKPTADT